MNEADALAVLEGAVVQAVAEPAAVVMAWFVVAAYREDGDGGEGLTRYYVTGPPGQPSYVSHGLLVEAAAHMTARDDPNG